MNHFRACSANRKSARRTGAPLDVFPSFSLVRRQKSRFCCLWKINERRCDVFIIEKSMEQNGTRRHAQQCWMWVSLFVVRPAATIRVGTDSFRWIPPSVTFFGTREHSFFSPGHSLTRPLFAGRDYFFSPIRIRRRTPGDCSYSPRIERMVIHGRWRLQTAMPMLAVDRVAIGRNGKCSHTDTTHHERHLINIEFKYIRCI